MGYLQVFYGRSNEFLPHGVRDGSMTLLQEREDFKKCEVFGCLNPADKMYQLGAATNVWMCQDCIDAADEAKTNA